MYAKLGGMERMRGYYEGRYRDKRLVETQIELRQKNLPPSRHRGLDRRRAGLGHRADSAGDNTLCSFGCGYRFEFKNRMNIRLDYGWGDPRQPQPPVGPQTLLGIPLHRLGSILRPTAILAPIPSPPSPASLLDVQFQPHGSRPKPSETDKNDRQAKKTAEKPA